MKANKLSKRDEAAYRFLMGRIPAGTELYAVVREVRGQGGYGQNWKRTARQLVNGNVSMCCFEDSPAVRQIAAECGLVVVG